MAGDMLADEYDNTCTRSASQRCRVAMLACHAAAVCRRCHAYMLTGAVYAAFVFHAAMRLPLRLRAMLLI